MIIYLRWEGGTHGVVVPHPVASPILVTVHVEPHNVPAVPREQIIIDRSAHRSPGKFVIEEAISKMELQPEEEEVEEFAWDSIHQQKL